MSHLLVVMGVSASGKSTVARGLAKKLDAPFLEGDDFHPAANVAKMAGGTPLTDEDRIAWLDAIDAAIAARAEAKLVLSCSALNAFVRTRLDTTAQRITYLYLNVPIDIIRQRITRRAAQTDHFMPASLVDSQFAALDVPSTAVILDGTKPSRLVIKDALAAVAARL